MSQGSICSTVGFLPLLHQCPSVSCCCPRTLECLHSGWWEHELIPILCELQGGGSFWFPSRSYFLSLKVLPHTPADMGQWAKSEGSKNSAVSGDLGTPAAFGSRLLSTLGRGPASTWFPSLAVAGNSLKAVTWASLSSGTTVS